jgi:sulfate adenylyltransferase
MSLRPHGGRLIDRVVKHQGEIEQIEEDARRLPSLELDERELSDLEMIATGAFSPLEGFMTRRDYLSVLEFSRLDSGLPWTIPITLATDGETARRHGPGSRMALRDAAGTLFGTLDVEDAYPWDRRREAEQVYRTTDTAHPGVRYLMTRGDWLLGGKIALVRRPPHPGFEAVLLDPAETRFLFRAKGWRTVAAFQTRNPVHRAHEYIQKCALEIVDALLLHPLVGATKEDDVPAPVRLRCYRVLLDRYFPPNRTVMSVFPAAMRYAGPREAIHHAIVRKNYGCTHIIIGRDHAGVGGYYGTYDAQLAFHDFDPRELEITPLFFDNAFYCRACEGMASYKTCPHEPDQRVMLSGTAVRRLLQAGELPPPEYSRPEVAEILRAAMAVKPEGSPHTGVA